MSHISNINTLKSIYYAYFHSVTKYGIIFWSNSSNSGKIFMLQKKTVRIMAGAQPRTSCRSLFEQLEILHVSCQNVVLLMHFIVNNEENFRTNLSMHNISTRNKHHLPRPNANRSAFQKNTFYGAIRIFNSLQCSLTICKIEKAKLKVTFRKYLNTHSFSSVDEFLYVKMIYNTVF
jgi:hypothetical protein